MKLPSLPSMSCIAATAAAFVLAPCAHAVEGGAPIMAFGVIDFGAGTLPPPSEVGTVGSRIAAYRANQSRDDAGNGSPVKPKVAVNSISAVYLKMTDITFGDFRYGWGAVVPYLDASVDLTVPTPVGPLALSGQNRAVGDVVAVPVILQWNPSPGLFTNFQLQVQMPTGSYDKNRLINAGSNHWSVAPTIAFTHIASSGLEVSSNIQLNFHGKNKATDYKSGTEYQHEFAVGQHIGSWTVGLGGYHLQQLTDDKSPGLVGGNRARVTALGPAVNFFELGSGLPVVWVHAYKEFNARNRTEGTQIAVRAAWTF